MLHRTEPFDHLFVWLSYAGSYGLVWLAIAFAASILLRRYAVFGLVLATEVLAEVTNFLLKHAFDRVRPQFRLASPEPLLHTAATPSFPSGHSTTSFACATVLALALPRLRVALFLLAALVAWSRVYVGVHYPLDVLAGAVEGVVVGVLCVRALPRLAATLRRSPRPRRSG